MGDLQKQINNDFATLRFWFCGIIEPHPNWMQLENIGKFILIAVHS
jgi:hypothetical protein